MLSRRKSPQNCALAAPSEWFAVGYSQCMDGELAHWYMEVGWAFQLADTDVNHQVFVE